MAEEKEAVGQMNAGDASTNDPSSLSRQSTGGPRTPEGKETSRHNSLKHGIFSKVVVLKGESRGTFNRLLNGLFRDLQPVGELEQILVEKIATLAWRYRRLIGTEVKNSTNIDFFDPEKARWNSDHLLRYEASIERAFDRALTQLERKQRMRLGQPILPPIKLDLVQHKIRPGAIIILLLIGRCGKSQNYKMNLANLLSRRNLVILAIGKSTRFGKSMG